MLEIQLVCWGTVEVDRHNTQAAGERNYPMQMLAAVAGHTTAVAENRYSKNANAISN